MLASRPKLTICEAVETKHVIQVVNAKELIGPYTKKLKIIEVSEGKMAKKSLFIRLERK